jgi:hypothetical protein
MGIDLSRVGQPSSQELLEAFDMPGINYAEKPTRTDMMEQLRHAERPFILYRYGQTWYQMEIGGQMYSFPPDIRDADGKPKIIPSKWHADPQTGRPLPIEADGIVRDMSGQKGIRTRYGIIRDMRNRGRVVGVGPLLGEGQTDIVMLAVDHHGEFGVVWLPGDATDGKRMAASKALYHKTIRTWAEEQDQSRQQFLRNWQNFPGNKGRIPPPPTANQRKAIDILDALRSEERHGAEWICPHGCSEWNEFASYARHMASAHGKKVIDPRQDTAGVELKATGIAQAEMVEEPDDMPIIEPNPHERGTVKDVDVDIDAQAQAMLKTMGTKPEEKPDLELKPRKKA